MKHMKKIIVLCMLIIGVTFLYGCDSLEKSLEKVEITNANGEVEYYSVSEIAETLKENPIKFNEDFLGKNVTVTSKLGAIKTFDEPGSVTSAMYLEGGWAIDTSEYESFVSNLELGDIIRVKGVIRNDIEGEYDYVFMVHTEIESMEKLDKKGEVLEVGERLAPVDRLQGTELVAYQLLQYKVNNHYWFHDPSHLTIIGIADLESEIWIAYRESSGDEKIIALSPYNDSVSYYEYETYKNLFDYVEYDVELLTEALNEIPVIKN